MSVESTTKEFSLCSLVVTVAEVNGDLLLFLKNIQKGCNRYYYSPRIAMLIREKRWSTITKSKELYFNWVLLCSTKLTVYILTSQWEHFPPLLMLLPYPWLLELPLTQLLCLWLLELPLTPLPRPVKWQYNKEEIKPFVLKLIYICICQPCHNLCLSALS